MSMPVPADFSDRVPPVLVKELRQGLRAKVFIALFIGLQMFLTVMLLSAGAASGSSNAGTIISVTIFLFFAFAVLLVQPMRGINALAGEVKDRTIEMMVLTRLSAWRIVFGKWVAIVGQSALLFSAIIPYLILRYFFGGMNLVGELMLLLLMFLTSMALTAVTIGLSGSDSPVVRGLLPILGLPALLILMIQLMFASRFGGGGNPFDMLSLSTPGSRIAVTIYICALVYIGGSMLSLGASLIAPAAENHSLVRRLVATGLILTALCAGFFGKYEIGLQVFLVFLIAVPAMIIALVESAPLVGIVRERFARFGPPGRTAGWLLYPCWPSGVLFAVVLSLLSLAALLLFDKGGTTTTGRDDDWIVILGILGAFLFPAVWQTFLFRGEGQRLGSYLLLLVGSFVLLGVLTAMSDGMNSSGFLWAFAWHPLSYVAMLEENDYSDSTILAGVLCCDFILVGILAFRGALGLTAATRAIDAMEPSTPEEPAS